MKKLVAILLTMTVIMSTAAGCTKKTGGKPSRKPTQATDDPEVTQAGLGDVPTEKRDNGKDAVFQLADTHSGKSTLSSEELDKAYSEFIFALLSRCAENAGDGNVLISADSVLFALNMAAAGADGETLNQMMNTMVPGADNTTAFMYAVARMNALQNDSLKIANSVWINEKKADNVYEDYLKYVVGHFDSGVSLVPFNDSGISTINEWVAEKTEDRIKELIDKLSPNDLMVLVNAMAFDGKWETEYGENDIYDMQFTNGKGSKKEVPFLSGAEEIYLDNGEAIGFLKPYDDGKYAFMTILPNDDSIDINEFMADMSPEEYWMFWESADSSVEVQIRMPEFKSEYEIRLPAILKDMGMVDAFDENNADFSNLCSTGAYISDVIHKTYIDVNRNGTQAAAATAVIVTEKAAMPQEETHFVICNRPFAYAIVDLDTGLPVFIGTVQDV